MISGKLMIVRGTSSPQSLINVPVQDVTIFLKMNNYALTYLYKYAIIYAEVISMGKTSNESKRKYNKSAYATHLYSYRWNSDFGERVREFKAKKGTSLNHLITKLLAKHWEVPEPMPHMDND